MSKTPIRNLIYVHNAIRLRADELVSATRKLNAPSEVENIRAMAEMFVRACVGHAVAEDIGYFPTLNEKVPHVCGAFSFDHEHENKALEEVASLSRSCTSDEDLERLRELATVLRAQLSSHMDKEETLLWALTDEHFSPPEQGAIVQAILAAVPKEDFPKLIPWIVDVLPIDEAAEYVGLLAQLQPPEVFAMTRSWIQDGVGSERMTELGKRVPALAS